MCLYVKPLHCAFPFKLYQRRPQTCKPQGPAHRPPGGPAHVRTRAARRLSAWAEEIPFLSATRVELLDVATDGSFEYPSVDERMLRRFRQLHLQEHRGHGAAALPPGYGRACAAALG